MFDVGEFVVYGTNGICLIKDITTLNLSGCDSERKYYVLESIRKKGNQSFVPVDSDKVQIRRVIAKAEAQELMDEIPMIDGIDTRDDKVRENTYKELVKLCECREWIRIIKTIYVRKQERVARGKKMTATDERYLRLAQDNLYEELGFSLGLDKDKLETYFTDCLHRK